MPIIVHIVDEDAKARGATSYALAGQGYSPRIYASAREFHAAIALLTVDEPACVLLSFGDSPETCFEVQREIARRGLALPVIGLSTSGDMGIAVEAMKRGAADVLRWPFQDRDLISAIERAIDRSRGEASRLAARGRAAARLDCLSQRERQILRGLLAGMTNKEIARRLELSPRTVEMHRANMMADLALGSLADAIRLAVEAELSPLEAGGASGAPTADALRPPPQIRTGRRPPSSGGVALQALLPPVIDVLEGTTDCVFLLDHEFKFTYLNANAVEAIAGGRALIGASLWEAFPRTHETRAATLLREAASQRKSVRFDFFHPDLDRWFDVSVRPIPSGLQVFFRDRGSERVGRTEAAERRGVEA